MSNTTTTLTQMVQQLNYTEVLRAAIILLVGWLLAKGARALVTRVGAKRFKAGDLITLQRIAYYTVLLLFVISALRQVGFNLEVLIGAAGVFTVAFGFASQTSASNLVSGLFLLVERPFLVNDVIKVNNVTGKVLSIDLLSTKISMADNTYIRIPNELLIKSEIANYSYFSIKRIEIPLIIGRDADLKQVESILLNIAKHDSLVLKDPQPAFKSLELYDYGVKVQLLVWGELANGDAIKNQLIADIKNSFKENNISLGSDKVIYWLGSEYVDSRA